MKSSLLVTIAIFVVSLTFAQNRGIIFEKGSFAQSLSKAKSNKKAPKLVFIDCYTEWCGPCKQMAEKVFPLDRVGDFFNANFVNLKIDMEKGEGIELRKRYNVEAFPTFLILDANGNEINRIVGGNNADPFIEKVKYSMNRENSLPALKAKYEEKQDMNAGLTYLKALSSGNLDTAPLARELYAKVDNKRKMDKDLFTILCGSIKTLSDTVYMDLCANISYLEYNLGQPFVKDCLRNVYISKSYDVAAGRMQVDVKEFSNAVATIGMLGFDPQIAMHHLGQIGLLVQKGNLDSLIDYYFTAFSEVPFSREKSIIENILLSKAKEATTEQKAKIKSYFEGQAKFFTSVTDYYTKMTKEVN